MTVNTIPIEGQMDALPGYLESLESAHADGLIMSDLGVLTLAKKCTFAQPPGRAGAKKGVYR